ncbi:DUF262 domain-containing protein [Streptomyces sp. KM273126]|uniref:DUF262 domain-containing protein n=1 Tax=Streptomyces sp. KM273126 TaxID=2545247 RepID=UPI0010388D2C|nr:DUF262 domain-containing protein [Streptomyces sp. KM273126]MBA2811807.1 DUF262 domain-containing protein [Streptomyces sp. KM273126]
MAQGMQQHVTVFSLQHLVHLAEVGRFRNSEFQRPAVWGRRQIVEFFDSISRGFPVGALVVYEGPAPSQEVDLGGKAIHAPEEPAAWTVIDGVQRLSALIGAWNASDDSRYAVCYDLEQHQFVPGPARHSMMLPVSVLVHPKRLYAWIAERFLSEAEISEVIALSSSLKDYTLPVFIMTNLPEQSTEIFRRLNQGGSALSRTDLERLAARPRRPPAGLQSIVRRVEAQGFGRISDATAAHCVIATSGPRALLPVSDSEVLAVYQDMSSEERARAEQRAGKALGAAVSFLREEARVPHVRLLPVLTALPVAVRFFSKFGPKIDSRAQELLRRWVWRADDSIQALEGARKPAAETALDESQRLLGGAQPQKPKSYQADMSATSLYSVAGRLNALGMLQAWPVVVTRIPEFQAPVGSPLEAPQLLTPWLDGGADMFSSFVPDKAIEHRTLGCFILHPSAPANALREGLLSLAHTDKAALGHHVFDDRGVALLQQGRFDELVAHREELLQRVISRRIQSMARWGFRDRGHMPTLSDTTEEPHDPADH